MDGSGWFLVIFTAMMLVATPSLCYFLLTKEKRLRKKTFGWTATTATVTEADMKVFRGGRGPALYQLRLTYRYTTPKGAYTGAKTFAVSGNEARVAAMLQGKSVCLRYDPGDVSSSAIFASDVRSLFAAMLPNRR